MPWLILKQYPSAGRRIGSGGRGSKQLGGHCRGQGTVVQVVRNDQILDIS